VRELPQRMSELDPDDNLVIYCRSGARSRRVAEELLSGGYAKVFNLTGGVLAWRDEVDPTLREY
jgi:sulfur-carrier protein adenylyltransferase/sulfurtransferase